MWLRLLVLAASLVGSACFASSPEVPADGDGSDDGGTTHGGETTSGSTAATGGDTTAATSSESGDGTSTGSPPATTTDATTSTTGEPPDTDSTDESAESTTDGEPSWVAECANAGFEVDPVPPLAGAPWLVRFTDPLPLTNIQLTISSAMQNYLYSPSRMCGVDPFCWEFDPSGDAYEPGPHDLVLSATEIPDATCTIELE